MRTQLIAGLVDILRFNLNRKADNVRVFELGRVFLPNDSVEDGPLSVKGIEQPSHIAGLAYGDAGEDGWSLAKRNVDFYDVKGDVESLIAPLAAEFRAAAHPALHPGRSAEILVNGRPAGFIGELHPRLCHTYQLPKAPVVFELDVAALLTVPVPAARAVSKFQPVHRDISVSAPAALTYQEMASAVEKLASGTRVGEVIESFKLFDLYRPSDDAAAEKSMAFRLTLVSRGEAALTEEQCDSAVRAVVEVLEGIGAHLRS